MLENFTKENLETALGILAEELAVKKGQLIHPTRLAVSGMTDEPGDCTDIFW